MGEAVGLREQHKEATRGRLLMAARQLLSERGTFTAEEIAQHASVSRATYFNYFPGKDDLLRALYSEHMHALSLVVDDLMATDMGTVERIVSVFDDFAGATALHADYLRAVTTEFERTFAAPDVSARHNEMFNVQMMRILDAGVLRGEVRTDHAIRFLAQMIGAIYMSTIRYWRQEPDVDFTSTFHAAGRFAAEAVATSPTPQD